MKTTTTGSLSVVLSLIFFSVQLSSWAGPPRPGMGRRDDLAQRRGVLQSAFGSGQVLLDTDGFVAGLVGSPTPPRIGPFRASLRIYLRGSNESVETVTTDAQGRFKLELRPGEYRIVPDIMQGGRVVARGDAQGICIIGIYEAAPALDISLKPNRSLTVTINYTMRMGS